MAFDVSLWLSILVAFINLLFALLGILAILLVLGSITRGAPFVPTKAATVNKMIELLEVKPGEKAVDLGSGDGRLVIALAKHGAEAHGYETNPLLVWWARGKIKKEGLERKARIHRQSLWKADCREFSAVTIFGVSYIMADLEKKLLEELPCGARVVSNAFSFPTWPCLRREANVFLYKKPL